MSYVFVNDATPLLVGPSNQQAPVCTFYGPADWAFSAGTYHMTLRATRNVASQPLEGRFALTLGQADVEFLRAHSDQFLPFKITR